MPHEIGIGRPSRHVLNRIAPVRGPDLQCVAVVRGGRRAQVTSGRVIRAPGLPSPLACPSTRTLSPQREGTYIPCSEPPVAGRCGAAPGLTSGGCGSHRTHAYLMRLELPPPPVLTARGSHHSPRRDVVARINRGARTVVGGLYSCSDSRVKLVAKRRVSCFVLFEFLHGSGLKRVIYRAQF